MKAKKTRIRPEHYGTGVPIPPMKANNTELDKLTAKIATLQRISPKSFKALATITDLALSTERQDQAARGAVSRRIVTLDEKGGA